MAPKQVAPYRMSGNRGKNDATDSAAMCEAMQRLAMRYVQMKTDDQQSRLCMHRVRQRIVEQRTTLINRVRGLLSEFGIVMP
jgi:transposase